MLLAGASNSDLPLAWLSSIAGCCEVVDGWMRLTGLGSCPEIALSGSVNGCHHVVTELQRSRQPGDAAALLAAFRMSQLMPLHELPFVQQNSAREGTILRYHTCGQCAYDGR